MSKWLNNEKQIHFPGLKSNFGSKEYPIMWEMDKPCHYMHFCPYGQLVEEYPIKDEIVLTSCKVFGHDCPAYYLAEPLTEDIKRKD